MANNMQLVRPTAKNSQKSLAVGSGNTLAKRLDTERGHLAEQLVLKMRVLANQAIPDDKQLQVAGAIWAGELIDAGIPPSKWDEMFTLARRSRKSASKAFMVTLDQVTDAWEHYLRGDTWSVAEEDWTGGGIRIEYCGQCDKGWIYYEQDGRMGQCLCWAVTTASNSYCFNRFSAAYELCYGSPYEASHEDLIRLHQLRTDCRTQMLTLDESFWDRAVRDYFSTEANHALKAFCESEVFNPGATGRSGEKTTEDFGIRTPPTIEELAAR